MKRVLAVLVLAILLLGTCVEAGPSPTAALPTTVVVTSRPTATPSRTPWPTPTRTSWPTPTRTSSPSPRPWPTDPPTITPRPTFTAGPSPTPVPTRTPLPWPTTAYSGLDTQARALLERSPEYERIIQCNNIILRVAAVSNDSGSAWPDLAVLYSGQWKNEGPEIPCRDTAPDNRLYMLTGVVIFRVQEGVYRQDWGMLTYKETWWNGYYDIFDITGDGRPEILIGGCSGFGNSCGWGVDIWQLDGRQIGDFGGQVYFYQDEKVIANVSWITHDYDYARFHGPDQWRLDFYRWDGVEFVVFDTQIFSHAEHPDGPPLPKE